VGAKVRARAHKVPVPADEVRACAPKVRACANESAERALAVRGRALAVHGRALTVRGCALAVRARAHAGLPCALEFFARALFGARCIPARARCIPWRAGSVPAEMEPSLTGTGSPHAGTLSPLLWARRIPVVIQPPLSGIVLAQSRACCIPASLCCNPAGTEAPLWFSDRPLRGYQAKKQRAIPPLPRALTQNERAQARNERGEGANGWGDAALCLRGPAPERAAPPPERWPGEVPGDSPHASVCNESCQPAEGNGGLPLEPGART